MPIQKTLLTVCVIAVLASPALAQRDSTERRPRALLRRCLDRVHLTSARAIQVIHATSMRCERAILAELEADNIDEAAALADRCTGFINDVARLGAERVGRVGAHCLEELSAAGAPDILLAEFRQAVAEAADRVAKARERALQAIADALASLP